MEETLEKKRMLSGIKPSGDLTLGSYLGAVKNWAERADQYDCFYFMADLHAITVRQNPKELRRRSTEQLAQYIACGLDPDKNTLFLQSYPVLDGAHIGTQGQFTAGLNAAENSFFLNDLFFHNYDLAFCHTRFLRYAALLRRIKTSAPIKSSYTTTVL